MKIFFVVILVAVVGYFVLGYFEVIPTYQCGSTMGPEGPVDWCVWSKGKIVG